MANHSGLRKNRCVFLYHVNVYRVRETCSSSSRVHHGIWVYSAELFISKEDTQLCGVEDGSLLFHYILTEWSRKRQVLRLTIPSQSPSRTFLTREKSRGQSQAGENLRLMTASGSTETSVYRSKVVSSCLHCGWSGLPDHVRERRQ